MKCRLPCLFLMATSACRTATASRPLAENAACILNSASLAAFWRLLVVAWIARRSLLQRSLACQAVSTGGFLDNTRPPSDSIACLRAMFPSTPLAKLAMRITASNSRVARPVLPVRANCGKATIICRCPNCAFTPGDTSRAACGAAVPRLPIVPNTVDTTSISADVWVARLQLLLRLRIAWPASFLWRHCYVPFSRLLAPTTSKSAHAPG